MPFIINQFTKKEIMNITAPKMYHFSFFASFTSAFHIMKVLIPKKKSMDVTKGIVG